MSLKENLSINLKYYRRKYNLSQEKFSEILGTSLSHLNKIEQMKCDVKFSTIEKYTNNLKKYDQKLNLQEEDLVKYDINKITNYTRIDEKK